MIADLIRVAHPTADVTQGIFRIDGLDACYTLEDGERYGPKIQGKTAIPLGTYRVELRKEGGMHKRYAERFPEFHLGMLWLREVPRFKWVYLHTGNDEDDTEGCPLVGDTLKFDGRVLDSVAAYKRIYPELADAAGRGELEVRITRA